MPLTKHPPLGAIAAMAMAVAGMAALPGLAGAAGAAHGHAHTQAHKMIEAGQKIAFAREKGNCLTCHHIAGGESPGDIGPPLVAVKARFPDKARLRAQIWDATVANPGTAMPPFGRNQILTEREIDEVTAFIWSK
jgi:L-cysteine S-thiosulfotransferase